MSLSINTSLVSFMSYLMEGSVPSISDVLVSGVTDTGFYISANIAPNKLDTTVFLHYGLTPSLTEVPIECTGSPITGITLTRNISATLTGLLPYKRYFYRLVSHNSKGSTFYNSNQVTLSPPELVDGNWVAQYDAEYENNEIVSDTVRALMDKQFGLALGIECNPQPTFDASSGINLAAGITIAGGDLIFTNVANAVSANFSIPINERVNGAYRLVIPGVNGRSGTIFNLSSSQVYAGGVAEANIPNGDYAKNVFFNNNGFFYFRGSGGASNGRFPGASLKRILGRHAWSNTANTFPSKVPTNNFIEFDGINDRLQAQNIATIGTVYAFVRRIGTDSNFVSRNDLTGIGEFNGTTTVSIGSNVAASAFYNVRLRRIWIRSITDNAGVIAKLNEWFSRDSYVIPPYTEGIVATGILNDSAIYKDETFWNDGV